MKLIDGLARMTDTDIDNLFKVTSMMNEIENDGRRDDVLFAHLLSLAFSEYTFKSKISELEFEVNELKQRVGEFELKLGEISHQNELTQTLIDDIMVMKPV